MTPANSTSLAAYGGKVADSPKGGTVAGSNASAGSLSSIGFGISPSFLAQHTRDQTLTENPQSICLNGALDRYTTSAVDPVLSIPAREDFATTHLQWRCTSEPSKDDISSGRTNRDPMPRVVMCPHTLSSDNPTCLDVSPGEAGAVGDAAEIITNVENLAVSSSGNVCSRDTDDRDGVLATSIHRFDESYAAPESAVVGEAAEVISKAGNLVDSSSGSVSACDASLEEAVEELVHLRDENHVASGAVPVSEAEEIIAGTNGPAGLPNGNQRFRDAGLEVLFSRYQEATDALEQGLWQRLNREQRLLQSATTQSSEEDQPTRNALSRLDAAYVSLAFLRKSLLQITGKIEQNCALVERVSSGQTRQDQAHAQSPVETRQAEAVQRAANAEPKQLCVHYRRRCYVRLSCCSEFFACHQCHNNSDKCDNKKARGSSATHLKCAQCQVVQEINEDSHRCSNCKIVFSEYFCAKCKHFTSKKKKPAHCEKCGICRVHMDKSFHCDVCNVCMDKRLKGNHGCRPDAGHEECCICFDDVFSGCIILPCSHKVHLSCALAMVENRSRSCPMCRHPFYSSAAQ